MIEFLLAQLFISLFNVTNAFIDAYRILENKTIAHAINFTAYAILILFLNIIMFWHEPIAVLLFSLSAFFNRQITFDIPLNLRRGLEWYYQSTANPPKAFLDRIERYIFGANVNVGKEILRAYIVCYCSIITAWVWLT